ncbi:hypothetical protein VNI00_010608 [Paramarasmius palmivorus]|uniref:F-box domain-containing protein n=1 Tax=Paramarasmius palmivorus TaxID=297713 RepID=A0AAW0CJ29_9AGAR
MEDSNGFNENIDLEQSDRLSQGLYNLLRSGRAPFASEELYLEKLGFLLEERMESIADVVAFAALRRKSRAVSSLGAPVRRLPSEILSEILVRAAVMNGGEVIEGQKCTSAGSRLGEVCSYWRDLTLKTPRIWGLVAVAIAWYDDSSDLSQDATLQHSQQLRIDSLLKEQLPRVHRLELAIPEPHVFLRSNTGLLDNVERLQVPGLVSIKHGHASWSDTIKHCCPNVRNLNVHFRRDWGFGWPFSTTPSSILPIAGNTSFPFDKITNLTIRNYDIGISDAWLAMIRSCKNLSQAHIILPSFQMYSQERLTHIFHALLPNQTQTPIQESSSCFDLTKLFRLEIQIEDVDDITDATNVPGPFNDCIRILDAISAPALTSLTIIAKGSMSSTLDSLQKAINSFLGRSNGRGLHDLRLYPPLSDLHLISLLANTPKLKKLALCGLVKTEDGLRPSTNQNQTSSSDCVEDGRVITLQLLKNLMLAPKVRVDDSGKLHDSIGSVVYDLNCHPQAQLLPELQDIHFSVQSWSSEYWSAFADILESRRPTLWSAVVIVVGSVKLEDIRDLTRLQEEGLAVRVQQCSGDKTGRFILGYGNLGQSGL